MFEACYSTLFAVMAIHQNNHKYSNKWITIKVNYTFISH